MVDLKQEADQPDRSDHRRDRPARDADRGRRRHHRRRRPPDRRQSAQPRQREGLCSGLRRPHRRAALDLPHHSAPRPVRARDVAGRLGRLYRQYGGVGPDLGWTWSSAWSICRSRRPPATTTAATAPGGNLFAESLVAVDLYPGERRWHFQLVHHGIWDHDIPCAPILLDLMIDGELVKAVAQPTKQAFLYVFNRETGEPIWPIEERPVEAGDVPGEWYSPTQPFPTKPPGYDRQGVALDDLIDFTAELLARSRRARFLLQARADLHAAGGEPARGADRHPDGPGPGRRHQLARGLLRPGDPHSLRVVEQLARAALDRAALPGAVRHGLHPGQRGRRTADLRRGGLERRRRTHRVRRAAAPGG